MVGAAPLTVVLLTSVLVRDPRVMILSLLVAYLVQEAWIAVVHRSFATRRFGLSTRAAMAAAWAPALLFIAAAWLGLWELVLFTRAPALAILCLRSASQSRGERIVEGSLIPPRLWAPPHVSLLDRITQGWDRLAMIERDSGGDTVYDLQVVADGAIMVRLVPMETVSQPDGMVCQNAASASTLLALSPSLAVQGRMDLEELVVRHTTSELMKCLIHR